ncbi:proteasome activator complex subunit 3 [Strongylocentrotus purpuratus]|uniref:Proteasome activator complex subunit 3 n=1 Tax=Strongylocentrotus purpuratus TaxID=7668 RepID=A0A7M7P9U6_STRPU|nr:proteasome activator complex subunit 3 [Strongylocentrotus purpuratus]|eukprot:XP_790819.2 PREDICTED: proteasome activator complex subunit 3 [Strongylocentrotus purpuratus]
MANDDPREVTACKDKLHQMSENLVKVLFPQKIGELGELVESDLFKLSRMSEVVCNINIPVPAPVILNNSDGVDDGLKAHAKKRKHDSGNDVTGCKVFSLPGGTVPCNKELCELIDILKPKICCLIENCNTLKMWIQLQIPRIEDGNNFGVSVQEDTLSELRQVESEAAAYLDQISRYYITRGKLISKVAKYPHVDDYRRSIIEIDEKEFINLRLTCLELRNTYLSLHDVITKNKDKIKKPRGNNTESMY